jgi:hypothetical protein
MRSRYELRVAGRLSERAAGAVGEFAGLTVCPGPTETTIHAAVVDEAQLHGLLALLESYGLRIAYMHRVDGAPEPARESPRPGVTRGE